MNCDKFGKQIRKAAQKEATSLLNKKSGRATKNVKFWDKEIRHRKRPQFPVLRKSACYKILSVQNSYKVLILKNQNENKENLPGNTTQQACRFCHGQCLCVKMKDKEFEFFVYDNLEYLQNKNCHMQYMRKTPANDNNFCATDVKTETMESDDKTFKCLNSTGQINKNPQRDKIFSESTHNNKQSNILHRNNTSFNSNNSPLLTEVSDRSKCKIKSALYEKADCVNSSDLKHIENTNRNTWFTFFPTKDQKPITSGHEILRKNSTDQLNSFPTKSASIVSRRNSDKFPGKITEKNGTIMSRRHSDRPLTETIYAHRSLKEKNNALASLRFDEKLSENSASAVSFQNSDKAPGSISQESDAISSRQCSDGSPTRFTETSRSLASDHCCHRRFSTLTEGSATLSNSNNPLNKVAVTPQHLSNNACSLDSSAPHQITTKPSIDKQFHRVDLALKPRNCHRPIEELSKTVKDGPVNSSFSQSTVNSTLPYESPLMSKEDMLSHLDAASSILSITISDDHLDVPSNNHSSNKIADPRLHPESVKKRKAQATEVSFKRVKWANTMLSCATTEKKLLDPRFKYSKLFSANPSVYSLKKKSSTIQSAQTPVAAENVSSSELSVKTRVQGSPGLLTTCSKSHSFITFSSELTQPLVSDKTLLSPTPVAAENVSSSEVSVKTRVQGSPESLTTCSRSHSSTTFPSEPTQPLVSDKPLRLSEPVPPRLSAKTSICVSTKVPSKLKDSSLTSTQDDKSIKTRLFVSSGSQSKHKKRPLTPPVVEKSAKIKVQLFSKVPQKLANDNMNIPVRGKSAKEISTSLRLGKHTNRHLTLPKTDKCKDTVPKKIARYSSFHDPLSSDNYGINVSSIQSASRSAISVEILDFNATSTLNEIKVAVSSKQRVNGKVTLNKGYNQHLPNDASEFLKIEKVDCIQSSFDTSGKIFPRTSMSPAGTLATTGFKKNAQRQWKVPKLKGSEASFKRRKGSKIFNYSGCSKASSCRRDMPKSVRDQQPVYNRRENTLLPNNVDNVKSVLSKPELQSKFKCQSALKVFKEKFKKNRTKSIAATYKNKMYQLETPLRRSCVECNNSTLPNIVPIFDFKVENFMEKNLLASVKPRYLNLKPSILWYKTSQVPLKLASRLSWECCLHFVCSQSQQESSIKPSSAMNLFDSFLQNSLSVHLIKHSNNGMHGVVKYLAARAIKLYNSKTKRKISCKRKSLQAPNNSLDNLMLKNDSPFKNIQELYQENLTTDTDVYYKNDYTEGLAEVVHPKEKILTISIWSKKNIEWEKFFGCSIFNLRLNNEYFMKDSISLLFDKESIFLQYLDSRNFLPKSKALPQRKGTFMLQGQFPYKGDLGYGNESNNLNLDCQLMQYSHFTKDEKIDQNSRAEIWKDIWCNNYRDLHFMKSSDFCTFHLSSSILSLHNKSLDFIRFASENKLYSSSLTFESEQLKCVAKPKLYPAMFSSNLNVSMHDEDSDMISKREMVNHSKKENGIIEEDFGNKVNYSPTSDANTQLSILNKQSNNSDIAIFVNTQRTVKDKIEDLQNMYCSSLISTNVLLSPSEEQSSNGSDITIDKTQDSTINTAKDLDNINIDLSTSGSVLRKLTSSEMKTLEETSVEEVVENGNCLLHLGDTSQGLNFNGLHNQKSAENSEANNTVPIKKALQCNENQSIISQDPFNSLTDCSSDHYQKEDSSGSKVKNSDTLFTSIAENQVLSPLEACSLLLESLWDGFEYPIEKSPSFQVPWIESKPQTDTLLPSTIAPKEAVPLHSPTSFSEKSLLASIGDTSSSAVQNKTRFSSEDSKELFNAPSSGLNLTSDVSGLQHHCSKNSGKIKISKEDGSSSNCSKQISTKLWQVPSKEHYPPNARYFPKSKPSIIRKKIASLNKPSEVTEKLKSLRSNKVQKATTSLPVHPNASNKLNLAPFQKVPDPRCSDEILPFSACEPEKNSSYSSTCELEDLLLSSVTAPEITSNTELDMFSPAQKSSNSMEIPDCRIPLSNYEQVNIYTFVPEYPRLLCPLDELEPSLDTYSPAEMINSNVFQTDCYLRNKELGMSVGMLFQTFHDFNFFEEGKPMHCYYHHLRGTGNHTLNVSSISKGLNNLTGDMLESYNFLNSQVEYHKSLLRGLVHYASDPNQDCDMKYMQRITDQLEYIEGYELACAALLL